MATFDADVKSARFEGDGRLTVQVTAKLVEGDRCEIRRAHLARPAPDAEGAVVKLASIDTLDVTLEKDVEWHGTFTWPRDASKIAHELGSAIVIFEPAAGNPVGIGFDFHAAPSLAKPAPAKRGGRIRWIPLVVILVGVALAVSSRACGR